MDWFIIEKAEEVLLDDIFYLWIIYIIDPGNNVQNINI